MCNLEKRPRKSANEADVPSGRFGELVEDCERFAGVHPRTEDCILDGDVSRSLQFSSAHHNWSSRRFASVHHFNVFVFRVAVDQESEFDFSCSIAAECTAREHCVGLLGFCCSATDAGERVCVERRVRLCVSLRDCTARVVFVFAGYTAQDVLMVVCLLSHPLSVGRPSTGTAAS